MIHISARDVQLHLLKMKNCPLFDMRRSSAQTKVVTGTNTLRSNGGRELFGACVLLTGSLIIQDILHIVMIARI
jgi:hypothetical protein